MLARALHLVKVALRVRMLIAGRQSDMDPLHTSAAGNALEVTGYSKVNVVEAAVCPFRQLSTGGACSSGLASGTSHRVDRHKS